MKTVTPIIGGVAAASELSMLCSILRPDQGINFLLSGFLSPHMLWAIPLGGVLGVSLCWILLWFPRLSHPWKEWREGCFCAVLLSLFVAPNTFGFLGLSRQTTEEYLTSLAILTGMAWCLIFIISQIEGAHLRRKYRVGGA